MDFDVLKQIVFSLIRTFATPVAIWIASTAQVTQDAAMNVLIVGATLLLTVIWSVFNKVRAEKKIETALELPAGSSKSTLKDVVASK